MSSSSTEQNPFANFKLWYYTPSTAAGGVFCGIFAILTALHLWRLIKTKAWFCIPFVVGGLFEAIGYAARASAASNIDALGPYVIQSILILIAPSLFAASIYMILARIILATHAESFSIIPLKFLTTTFVIGDVLCFLMQSSGGGLIAMADTASAVRTAENIILGGLILQIVVFFFFVGVAALFHKRLSTRPTIASLEQGMPWRRLMGVLYLVSVLITVRNVVRVVEFAQGYSGYLLTTEWPIYVFDALFMAAVLAVCLMWYLECIKPGAQSGQTRTHSPTMAMEVRPKMAESA